MSDAVQMAIIAACAGAVPTIVSGWVAVHQKKIAASQDAMAATVLKLEKNTNSIKDALIESTAKASHAEGVLDEKARVGNLPA